MERPKVVLLVAALLTVFFAVMFVRIDIDTDPENMLPADAPVRLRNADMRETFGTGDMIVVGLFADERLVTPEGLGAAVALHDAIAQLDGVAEATMISVRTATVGDGPATIDDAEAIAGRIR